jgi:hypothetical protein
MMDIVDIAIHPSVSRKSNFHGNSNSSYSQMTNTSKKISGQNMLAFQRYFGARN